MFFWKKGGTEKVLEALRQIDRQVRKLTDIPQQISEFKNALGVIDQNAANAKAVVLERAEEEKSKPWIDARFDALIDAHAKQEVDAIEVLQRNIATYRDLAAASETSEDIRYVLDELKKELNGIELREASHEESFKGMERQTLTERLRRPSADVPPDQTKDGTPFSSVARVVRQLGGWMVVKVRHQAGIQFKKEQPPVVISPSLGTQLLAKEVIVRMREAGFPEYKIPNQSNLQKAFRSGDIHQAA